LEFAINNAVDDEEINNVLNTEARVSVEDVSMIYDEEYKPVQRGLLRLFE
jgi:hypothetical protein